MPLTVPEEKLPKFAEFEKQVAPKRAEIEKMTEQQFDLLAPKARAEVSRTVDAGRGQLRGELIAMAMAEGGRTHGGAP